MKYAPSILAVAAILVASAANAEALDPIFDADPFTIERMASAPQSEPALREYLRGMVAASRLDTRGAELHLRAAWSTPGASETLAANALSGLGTVYLRIGRYRAAGELLDRAISEGGDLAPSLRRDFDQARGVAMALRDEPAQSTAKSGTGTVPLALNMLGLTTAPVLIDGHGQQAVLDTGANLSTLSATAAKTLGVKMLSRQTAVGSSTAATVPTTIAVARSVKFGPVTLHNVAFLVVSDAALSPLGPKSRIDVILGFPVLAALGRVTFRETTIGKPGNARTLHIAPSPHSNAPGNLRFSGFNAYVRADVNGESVPFFLDSGADRTVFEKRYAREHPEKIASLARKTARIGGAGQVEDRSTAVIPALALTLGKQTVSLSDVRIELDGSGSDANYATLGSDALWAKGGYTIDFGKLNLSLGK